MKRSDSENGDEGEKESVRTNVRTKKSAPWSGRAENARRKNEKPGKFPQGYRADARGKRL
jgi:hypothetical protein